jgi:hypothetical protein
MKEFWLCWVDGGNGGYGFQHSTFESAKSESERLAKLPDIQGKKVYVLNCCGATIYKPTQWESVDIPDVPF